MNPTRLAPGWGFDPSTWTMRGCDGITHRAFTAHLADGTVLDFDATFRTVRVWDFTQREHVPPVSAVSAILVLRHAEPVSYLTIDAAGSLVVHETSPVVEVHTRTGQPGDGSAPVGAVPAPAPRSPAGYRC